MENFLIWSHEHNLWWGRNERGYVAEVDQAGRYDKATAVALTLYHIPAGEEVAVLLSSALTHGRGAVWGIPDPPKVEP